MKFFWQLEYKTGKLPKIIKCNEAGENKLLCDECEAEELNIEFETLQDQSEVKIIGVDGRTLFAENVFAENGIITLTLELPKISSGIYMVVVKDEQGVKVNKLVIE